MSNLTREEMRLYMRDYRARKKASGSFRSYGRAKPHAKPRAAIDRDWAVVDTSLPRDAITSASDTDHERIRAKAAAIGRGKAVITMTNGRLDVVSREAFEPHPVTPSPSPSRA
jgi:hypothetical protein